MPGDQVLGMPKKQALLLGGGAVVVLGFAYMRYRSQQQQQAAAQAAVAAQTATGTGNGTSDQIDPATGFPYGSAEDAAALTAQASYNSPYGGLGYSDTSYLYGGEPYYPGSSGYPTAGGYTSNSQWSQAAQSYLSGTVGTDAGTVSTALGLYITGQEMSSAQQAIVEQAIAFVGYPPVAGPDGYPPSIRTAPPTSTTPPPTPPPGNTVKVPNTVGGTAGNAHNLIVNAGLTPIDGNWQSGDASKKVTRQNPAAGSQAAKGAVVVYYHA